MHSEIPKLSVIKIWNAINLHLLQIQVMLVNIFSTENVTWYICIREMAISYWLQSYYTWIILLLLKGSIFQSLISIVSSWIYLCDICVWDFSVINVFEYQVTLFPFKKIGDINWIHNCKTVHYITMFLQRIW